MTSDTPQETPGRVRNNIQKELLMNDIEKHLLGFSNSQLKTKEILQLFDLHSKDLTQAINKFKLSNDKLSVIDLLKHKVSKNYTIDEMKDISYSLQLYHKALCSRKYCWRVIKLMEPFEDFEVTSEIEKILLNVRQAFRIKGLNAIVKVSSYGNLLWVMVIEKLLTRRRGIKLKSPIFFCFEAAEPYLFFLSNSQTRPTILECIVKAMSYKKSKVQNLQGKDIMSMLDLLKNRAAYKENLRSLQFNPGQAAVGSRSVNFSQIKAREEYANQVFNTNGPVNIETFTVHADTVWKLKSQPDYPGEQLRTSLVLKSKTGNVIDMIKHMQTRNMVATPLPQYMQEILRSARNCVNMRTQTP